MKKIWWSGVAVALSCLLVSGAALAQDGGCDPGDEFCYEPPCYRDPDNPDCTECDCDSPDYPECDPWCSAGDICDPECGNPCWDEFGQDICSEPPPPCEPEGDPPFTFVDDQDGDDDGQIYALGTSPQVGCGTLLVEETGYYSIYDTELSESCDDQQDETGYLTIENSCNGAGWAVERNAGDRFLIFDSDNSPDCDSDDECDAGQVCREGNSHGRCCVPEEPVFMGTFLLVAGEPNRICINHWCPEWEAEMALGHDFGFVVAECTGANSIHFRIGATAIACEDETHLQACSWGCEDGTCVPDPCDAADCEHYCMDGVCLDDNPCADVVCEHGCLNGRCLQGRYARGPDRDDDGFTQLADCDDHDATVNPRRPEICENGKDDNCDGWVDELPCEEGGGDGGADGGPDGDTGSGSGSGCSCRAAPAPAATAGLLLLCLSVLPLLSHRR